MPGQVHGHLCRQCRGSLRCCCSLSERGRRPQTRPASGHDVGGTAREDPNMRRRPRLTTWPVPVGVSRRPGGAAAASQLLAALAARAARRPAWTIPLLSPKSGARRSEVRRSHRRPCDTGHAFGCRPPVPCRCLTGTCPPASRQLAGGEVVQDGVDGGPAQVCRVDVGAVLRPLLGQGMDEVAHRADQIGGESGVLVDPAVGVSMADEVLEAGGASP